MENTTQLLEVSQNIIDETEKRAEKEKDKTVYDADAVQNIPLVLFHGSEMFEVSIEMNPVEDEEWLKLVESVPANIKKVKSISFELFAPFANLGREKATAQHNYEERSDWKTATPDEHFMQMMNSYLQVSANVDDSVTEKTVFRFTQDAPIRLTSNQSGNEVETVIYFKLATREQMDEYLLIEANTPNKNHLASAQKISKERRYLALYNELKTRDENYASRVPAWHAIEAVKVFMDTSISNMGKQSRR